MFKLCALLSAVIGLMPVFSVSARTQTDPASQAVVIDSRTGVTGGPSAVVYQTKPRTPSKNTSVNRPGIPSVPARPAQAARPQDATSNPEWQTPIAPVIVIQPKVPGTP